MDFKEYLKKYNAQKKINKLVQLYKNKKIAIYGAGQFARTIFENYDLSKLNIVGIADLKFEDPQNRDFFGLNCIEPKMLGTIDCDIILIANYDYDRFLTILDDHILYLTKNDSVTVRPLIKLNFRDIFITKGAKNGI